MTVSMNSSINSVLQCTFIGSCCAEFFLGNKIN